MLLDQSCSLDMPEVNGLIVMHEGDPYFTDRGHNLKLLLTRYRQYSGEPIVGSGLIPCTLEDCKDYKILQIDLYVNEEVRSFRIFVKPVNERRKLYVTSDYTKPITHEK